MSEAFPRREIIQNIAAFLLFISTKVALFYEPTSPNLLITEENCTEEKAADCTEDRRESFISDSENFVSNTSLTEIQEKVEKSDLHPVVIISLLRTVADTLHARKELQTYFYSPIKSFELVEAQKLTDRFERLRIVLSMLLAYYAIAEVS